ncbi:hypothetical protein ACFYS8_00965 [Kitasatospora sp. NPDC004615]|uniref:hypothetical protein n=1 Tax=unclassified Kitasatospora TaxID=2633591 RepID=UPI0036AC75E5
MRTLGITYDTGTFTGERLTRRHFDPAQVRHDLTAIADELHCDAVRITGGDPERLDLAAQLAADAGLEVWYSPFPADLPPAALLPFFADCARRAETLRRTGARVVFVAGCELSVFAEGFLPGATHLDRLHAMTTADLDWWLSLGPVPERLNAFLAETASAVRREFAGPVGYASGPWEPVDWTPFDLVGLDAYRSAQNAADYREQLRAARAHGKPVAVTEFGTCAYRGATDLGGMAWQVPPGAVPDETEQVRCFGDLLDVFEEEGVGAAFWYTFASYDKPGLRDLGSYGVVRTLDGDGRWERKQVFDAMAGRYRRR